MARILEELGEKQRLEADLAAAGLRSRAFLTDPEGLFALSVAAPAR